MPNNMTILEQLKQVANTYPSITKETFAGCNEGQAIRHIIPERIVELCSISTKKYRTYGSIGDGNLSEIPWVLTCYLDHTKSAKKGIYIVLLFRKDMAGIYLTLNQGITDFGNNVEGRKKASFTARNIQSLLTKHEGFSTEKINLRGNNALGKGYEDACILQKYYDFSSSLPSDAEFKEDYLSLLSIYNQVLLLIGKRNINEFYDYELAESKDDNYFDEETDQSKIEDDDHNPFVSTEVAGKPKSIPDYDPSCVKPETKKEPVKSSDGHKHYPRSKDKRDKAFSREKGNGCECCGDHSFIAANTLQPYFEAHHIIPMALQDSYPNSLDVPANIAILDANCHEEIHHGLPKDKRKLLDTLYSKHHDDLNKSGIEISIKRLYKIYGC